MVYIKTKDERVSFQDVGRLHFIQFLPSESHVPIVITTPFPGFTSLCCSRFTQIIVEN